MSVANHTFTDSIGGKSCTGCGMTWRALVEQRERWKAGEAGLVCGSTRALYGYEATELENSYQAEVAAVSKAFGW
jgi:hypothetical protein